MHVEIKIWKHLNESSSHPRKCLWSGSEKSKTGTQVITVQTMMIEVCALNLNEHLEEKMVVAAHDLNLETTHCGSL